MIEVRDYEFHVYGATPEGDVPPDPIRIDRFPCFDVASALRIARKLVMEVKGPVDVAVAGGLPWAHRYVTTGCPKYPNTESKAVLFERLD